MTSNSAAPLKIIYLNNINKFNGLEIFALLSQRIVVGDSCVKLTLESNVRNQIASFDASRAAVYSASHDEVATVFCFRDCQDIGPDPKVNR